MALWRACEAEYEGLVPREPANCPNWRREREICADYGRAISSGVCDDLEAHEADFKRFRESFGALFLEAYQQRSKAVEGCPAPLFEAIHRHEAEMKNSDPRRYVALRYGEDTRFIERSTELAPIDIPQEAVAALWLEGLPVSLSGTPVRASRGGFDVQVRKLEYDTTPAGGCEREYERREYRDIHRVDPQGLQPGGTNMSQAVSISSMASVKNVS